MITVMLFQKKIDRAQKWLHDRNSTPEVRRNEQCSGSSDLPSMEELKAEAREEIYLDKKDLPAMIIAAMITIMPVCILVLLAICAVVFLIP